MEPEHRAPQRATVSKAAGGFVVFLTELPDALGLSGYISF